MNNEIYSDKFLLRLTPVSQKHLTERYISWLNDKEVVKYSELRHSVHTYESCRAYWESFQGKPHLFFAIEISHHQMWCHIGNINAYIDEKNKIADIGILIGDRKVWGKGYGTRAWQTMCDYLFEKRHIRKITGGTLSINKGMIKLMQNIGMVEDGRRIKHYLCENQEVDICHYALYRQGGSEM